MSIGLISTRQLSWQIQKIMTELGKIQLLWLHSQEAKGQLTLRDVSSEHTVVMLQMSSEMGDQDFGGGNTLTLSQAEPGHFIHRGGRLFQPATVVTRQTAGLLPEQSFCSRCSQKAELVTQSLETGRIVKNRDRNFCRAQEDGLLMSSTGYVQSWQQHFFTMGLEK